MSDEHRFESLGGLTVDEWLRKRRSDQAAGLVEFTVPITLAPFDLEREPARNHFHFFTEEWTPIVRPPDP